MRLEAQPGESCEEFLDRVVARAGLPTPEQAARLRQLLPIPAAAPVEKTSKAA